MNERPPRSRAPSGAAYPGERPAVTLAARNLTRGTVLGERIETAGDFWAKFMGLMGRPALAPGEGLWLPGANGIHMMFMRFPIDAIFVGPESDGERTVLAVRPTLPTWRGIVPFVARAKGCLELPAGTAAATGTRVGDRVILEGA